MKRMRRMVSPGLLLLLPKCASVNSLEAFKEER